VDVYGPAELLEPQTPATMLQKRISSLVSSVAYPGRTRLYSNQFSSALSQPPASADTNSPTTHYRITLYRSAIALPKRYKATLVSLGIHRRMQTVYHPHTPDIAGKILRVKELVEVQNVPASSVRTKTEQRWERRPRKGYEVAKTWKDAMW
jgi:large subunit ribosomal protein L30